MGKVIAVANQKGGVGKTTTAAVLGDLLSSAGKKVLLIDMDGQANLTYNMGVDRPDFLSRTTKDVLMSKVNGESTDLGAEMLLAPGLSLFPSNIELASMEMTLINAFQREQILSMVVDELRESYDYIVIDTSPSLGLLTINSLIAADEVVIPVSAQIFAIRGMEQLFKSISLAQRINQNLKIAGFLITMVDGRSDDQKDTINQLRVAFGGFVDAFEVTIPFQINAPEAPKQQQATTAFDPNGAAAKAYRNWLAEYLGITLNRDNSGNLIEIGDELSLENELYQVHFGDYERVTRDGKKVNTLGIYAAKLNDPEAAQLSIGSFMMKYRRN